jgi:hypothetical protein
MSQKSSLLQPAQSVSWVLMPDSLGLRMVRGLVNTEGRRGDRSRAGRRTLRDRRGSLAAFERM